MAVTSKERRGRLEDAYVASAGLTTPTSLRAYLRSQEQSARAAIKGGSFKVVSAGGFAGHRAEFFEAGVGQITQVENVEAWRDLVDSFDQAFTFLSGCAAYGLDPFVTEFSPPPSGAQSVQSPVVVDSTGRFAQLCLQFGITTNTVVGAAVGDKSVFLWMMFHEVPALEAYSDYGQMRIAQGAQFV